MLRPKEIRSYYENGSLKVPSLWNLSRKHVRIQAIDRKWIKLNKFENRLNSKELKEHLTWFAPLHVYFSVLDWLFPERVGKKYKGNYAVPFGNGEFVVDVDAYVIHRWHEHEKNSLWNVCSKCLEISKQLTIHACDQLEWYYSDIAIVFSGKNGFHIHVLDFKLSDWTKPNYNNLIKSHEAARFKFSKVIALQTYCFDRAHFILSVDPMRVITVPNTLNAESGLVCTYIGNKKDLELQTIQNILVKSQPSKNLHSYPEPYEK